MAKYINSHSSNLARMTQLLDQESTALASCYSVESSTAKVQGFHYCTTPGTGIKSTILSPPLDIPAASAERNWPGITQPEHKGEATHTIPEECERLFCDRLSAIFLGERIGARQESLGMGVFQDIEPNQLGSKHDRIQRWIEVWDYTGDAIYRGFVAELEGERTLFVFLEDEALSHGLKLIALFELAGIDAFNCSQIVACVRRSQQRSEVELVHNLGWCGFNLTTLEPWAMGTSSGPTLSTKWLFLVAEV
ncbi:hypothetical protein N7468_010478 [Penicillium chermesinum]|uniref:Ornithine decarboxylase antizyme n=1 Tax=Penicillium chermesinum TaxID=63820 RepID=A0A9W9N7Q9_9EURO|nr:uncharacterized protein N7468_010478 [Penicillium chermesinum]KAJ5214799.1 hypothetical protein N7468_010478 [Penicillium chermesinum]